ncbi:hypothetical protein VB780_08595 [Leptolyngbya sp. CCNP1308]|nr:hypothetical protein [Leptolyngbya sp. CCNP1308]
MQKTFSESTEIAVYFHHTSLFLIGAVALAAAGHIVVHALSYLFDIANTPFVGVFKFFSMGQEANFPTYISALNLLLAAGLCLLVSRHDVPQKKRMSRYWVGLSVGLLLMSIDEAAQIHEGIIGVLLENYLGRGTGVLYYRWYLAYIPLVIVIGCSYLPFLKRLPLRYSSRLCLAGLVFLGGAIGVEMLESVLVYAGINTAISILFEETFEMLGIVIFIDTVLLYLSELDFRIKLNFSNKKYG